MQVLILAGGQCPPELIEETGVQHRSQLPYKGRPMLDIVIDAVAHLGKLVIVGDVAKEGATIVPSGKSFVESLAAGLAEIQDENFLLVTADMPFLTRAGVDDFLAKADPNVLINYPIIPLSEAEAQFPGMKRTSYKLAEGKFTGGNLSLIRTGLMRQVMPKIDEAYANRKSVLKLAKLIGLPTLFRFVIGAAIPAFLTIRSIEASIGKALGGPVKGVITHYPEIGADIDSAEQYRALVNAK